MNVLTKFRGEVVNQAAGNKDIFKLTDDLRDSVLPVLGLLIEDKGKGQESIWKYQDPQELLKEMQAKREAKEAEKAKKEQAKKEREALQLKQNSTPGKDYFRVFESDKYSKFDEETGVPTHDQDGQEVNQQLVKGFQKKMAAQEKKYQKWLASTKKEDENKNKEE